jgi:hypothetical protein
VLLIREGLRDIPQMKGMLDGLKDAGTSGAGYFSAQTPVRVATRNQQRHPTSAARIRRKKMLRQLPPDYADRQQIRLAGRQEVSGLLQRSSRDHAGLGR